MANRYWVGGSGTWDATSTTHWSASSGGASGASVPTTSDNVFFDRATTYTVTLVAGNTLDCTVSAGTVTFSGTSTTLGYVNVAGNFSVTSATSWTIGTIIFIATTAKTITTNGITLNVGGITFDGIGGTWQLQDALTGISTTSTTLTNGTLDINSKTFTTGLFSSSGSSARTIAFGTGNITCLGSGIVFDTTTATGLTITGTPVVNITYSGASTVQIPTGAATEARTVSFNFTAGTYSLYFLDTASYSARNVDFTGFAGTWAVTSTGFIYGSLTLSSGMTLTTSSSAMTLGGTSGTKTITSNSRTMPFPINLNGAGSTWQLQDALTMPSTRALNQSNGTLDLNGKTLTIGASGNYIVSTAGTKNITFNGGTIICPTASTTSFNVTGPTGFTTTAGTGTGKISMTAATAKTFGGGGSTFNCTLSNDGAGALTISGANTFTTIANGVQPTSFVFPIATTQTVTNWNVRGTAGNLVTITSGTAGVPALLSKASGIVSSNYLSLKDSTATGGATWYAGANSTNVSGNLGWIFSSAPATNTGNFFFMF